MPHIELISLLVALYARDRGGPFLELGVGFSSYSLELGTGDPIEPISKATNSFLGGHGSGIKAGVGWEFHSGFTPRISYSLGREDSLDAGGTTIARGWTHKVLLIEVGGRGP